MNSNGEISLKSTKSFKEYPDLAIITLYDREDNILDNDILIETMSTIEGKYDHEEYQKK